MARQGGVNSTDSSESNETAESAHGFAEAAVIEQPQKLYQPCITTHLGDSYEKDIDSCSCIVVNELGSTGHRKDGDNQLRPGRAFTGRKASAKAGTET